MRDGSKYHVADILPAASKGALLAFIINADEEGFSTSGPRTVIVLKALGIVVLVLGIVL